jgi:hypothetical protein
VKMAAHIKITKVPTCMFCSIAMVLSNLGKRKPGPLFKDRALASEAEG